MTILLRWLIDNVWVLYVVCGIGALIYVVRALAAQRERDLALFTLERESATARLVQSWSTALVFVALGAIVFVLTRFVLPDVPILNPDLPLPTATLVAGVAPITPSPGPSPTPQLLVGTPTPTIAGDEEGPSPTAPPPPPTAPAAAATPTPGEAPPSTPVPTEAAQQPVSGDVSVQFGDFARLVGFTVSTVRTTTGAPLQLTLYWQALDGQSPVDYVVFTHLLAEDGHLVAQHDGHPAGGSRPTTSWTPGESIVDTHLMAFKDLGYVGSATLVVGLYVPDGDRVSTSTGADHVVLPVAITVIVQQ